MMHAARRKRHASLAPSWCAHHLLKESNLTPVIALDVGHSAVKVVADSGTGRYSLMFPSVVSGAVELMESNARRAAERETVEVDGRRWFFGETAVTQGSSDSESGMSENWISTSAYSALVAGAFLKLSQRPDAISTENSIIVVGLPARYMMTQKKPLTEVMQRLAPSAQIVVLPQPLGPFMCMQFDESGNEDKSRNTGKSTYGIIEVGHFTTDFGAVKNGLWVDKNAGSCDGAHVVVKKVAQLIKEQRGHSLTLIETTKAIVDGSFMEFGTSVDITPFLTASAQVLVDKVLDTVDRLMDRDARSFDGIAVAGGAAPILFQMIKAKYRHAFLSSESNSRMAVAEGFYRGGCALRNDRRARSEKARTAAISSVNAPIQG